MGMFGQLGDMYRLQKEAKKIKKELAKTHISAEADGITVAVNGEQEIVDIQFAESFDTTDKKALAKALTAASNRAMKKAQQVAAEKMKPIMEKMGMGGGMGA